MFNIDQIVKALKTDSNAQRQAMTGAAGLAAGMLFSGGGLGKMVGTLTRTGAVAAIGGLAYTAWQNHQRQQGATLQTGPVYDAFVPPADAASEREELGKSLVRAMIAAAKADGRIDGEEKDRIFARVTAMPLSAAEKAWVFDELASPLNIDEVAARANTPAHAAEIYAASLVAIEDDTEQEKAYLATLASKLKLEPSLVLEIHRAAKSPTAPEAQPSGQNIPAQSV